MDSPTEATPLTGGRLDHPRWRAFRALRNPGYRLLFFTTQFNQLGFWISFVALQALMARLTGSDGTWLGLLFFTSFIPLFILTPVGGVVADRVDRKRIMIIGAVVNGGILSILSAITIAGHATPTLLLPFSLATGCVFGFSGPAGSAVTANAVPAHDLSSAISLQAMTVNLSRVVGPTVAAPILVIWGEGAAFGVYAATNVIAAALLTRVRVPAAEFDDVQVGFWASLRAGFQHARERPPAVRAMALLCSSSLFAGGYLALLPVIGNDVFDKGPRGFTTLAAVSGLGSMIGAFSTGMRDEVPTIRSAALLVGLFGVSLAAFGQITSWPLGIALMVPIGLFYFAAMTSISTLLQHLSHDSKRGRIMALYNMGWGGLVPIAGLWAGVLADNIGIAATVTLAGSATAVYAFATFARSFVTQRRP